MQAMREVVQQADGPVNAAHVASWYGIAFLAQYACCLWHYSAKPRPGTLANRLSNR
ncbi:MAG TPA: hypothetical protein VGA96_01320 [Fibrella sp.]